MQVVWRALLGRLAPLNPFSSFAKASPSGQKSLYPEKARKCLKFNKSNVI